MSNELIEKVIRTNEVASGGGGLLSPEQTNKFIDYMWDETVLGKQVRKVPMRANEAEIDKINVGQRIVRLATEAVDDGVNAGATFSKISLTTKKLRLDWELSTESLEDNIEGGNLEEHIARLMATQAGNDIEDLAINGDTTSADPLLKAFDGYSKLLEAGAHVVDANGGYFSRATLNRALKTMPRKFLQRRGELKFFAGSGVVGDYIYSLQAVENGLISPEASAAAGINQAQQANGPAGFVTGNAFGLTINEVPLFNEQRKLNDVGAGSTDHTSVWLLDPKNLLWGIKREIKVYRKFAEKKDTTEWTLYTRVGVQVENLDAVVVVKNIKAAALTV